MIRSLSAVLGAACLALPAGAADASFSQTLRAAEFAAAGLNKLTPQELARLDAFVREFQAAGPTGVGSAPRAEYTARRVAERPPSSAKGARPANEAPPAAAGAPSRAKVRVAPGTEVEYIEVESRIAGEFRGWERRTVFALENGQRWRTDGSSIYVAPPVQRPAVKITPGLFGSFWMTIEGVRQRVKVAPAGDR